jgi:alkylation response protein AidB-like acyl-CoA dehydrogenase
VETDGRAALERWRATRPPTFYDDALGRARPELEGRLRAFGEAVARVVDPAVARLEARRDLPRLGPEDEVEFDDAYAEAGRAVWSSGVLAAGAFEQAALLYLLAHAGEGGHSCPVVCTAGLVRGLRRHASADLRDRFLPPLLDPDYDRAERGAQFLTEIQGGSDVGANRVEAVPDGDGLWRISGEKWFCSVADADQFVVTARPRGAPEGTRGIGCFLVPRRVDGAANGFSIRRLKDKLGTRALATGEIEFDGALGYAIGAPEDGFQIAAGDVLNTSRWLNAFGSAGLMRRAYLEASSFARIRTAFGRPLAAFPAVRENLAVMKAEAQGALASSLELTALVERLDGEQASEDDAAWHRVLVNANKVVTSLAATNVARRGIEALGGNGTIEDFSPLPRLWRDAIVFESWEGTHNVLCAQVLRDLCRLDAVDLVLERIGDVDTRDLGDRLRRSVADPGAAALHFRRRVGTLVRAVQVSALRSQGAGAAADLLERRHLVPGYDPERDAAYAGLLDSVLAGDA